MNAANIPKSNPGSVLVKVIAATLLFAALGRHAYDYYTLLKWISAGVCAFTAFQAIQVKKFGWFWIFAVSAAILNPVAPLRLKRETWNVVDPIAGVLLLSSIVVTDIRKSSINGEPLQPTKDVQPGTPENQTLPSQAQKPNFYQSIKLKAHPYLTGVVGDTLVLLMAIALLYVLMRVIQTSYFDNSDLLQNH
jgi:hypothetical protein